MERKNTNSHVKIQNSETFCKCKGKYALVENTEQILMILTHGKVIHPPLKIHNSCTQCLTIMHDMKCRTKHTLK
jgi:hypothetical protein